MLLISQVMRVCRHRILQAVQPLQYTVKHLPEYWKFVTARLQSYELHRQCQAASFPSSAAPCTCC